MAQPAARVGDMHVCPMSDGPKPHVGGPILSPGVPTVLIGFMPAAVVSNMCTCVGPPDSIVKGSMTVLIGGKPAARMGDMTAHGGVITVGCPTVLIGDVSTAFPPLVKLDTGSYSVVKEMVNNMEGEVRAQNQTMINAAVDGKVWCEKCGKSVSV